MLEYDIELLKDCIKPYKNNNDKKSIINSYIEKQKF